MLDFLLYLGFAWMLFTLSMILAGVVRVEKHLKTLQEDFRMFLNFYLTKK